MHGDPANRRLINSLKEKERLLLGTIRLAGIDLGLG